MRKTNWVPNLRKILRFATDLLESHSDSGKASSQSRRPRAVKQPFFDAQNAKPQNAKSQNTKAKPSHVPQARDNDRANTNAGTAKTAPKGPVTQYPGDFFGKIVPRYAPELDGEPDPGEIVWTWVPYEEDHSQGKDRPVLIVGSEGPWLLGLMLSSKDHASPDRPLATSGPRWLDIGSGPWDAQDRESEIRLDRVIRIDPTRVRREGAIMPKDLFLKVASHL